MSQKLDTTVLSYKVSTPCLKQTSKIILVITMPNFHQSDNFWHKDGK